MRTDFYGRMLMIVLLLSVCSAVTVFAEPLFRDEFAALNFDSDQDTIPSEPEGLRIDAWDDVACGGERVIRVDGVNGDDRNTGLSSDNAVKTLTRAAQIVRGGDVMIVQPGTYYEKPHFDDIGSSGDNPVWIRAAAPGQVTISGLWQEADQGTAAWRSEGHGVFSAAHDDVYSGSYRDVYLFRI